jgi:hypothetical protein
MKDSLPNKIGKRNRPRAKSSAKNNINRARAAERHSLAVYRGQIALGFVEQRGGTFTAKTFNGKKIGVFDTLKVAADAISATVKAA